VPPVDIFSPQSGAYMRVRCLCPSIFALIVLTLTTGCGPSTATLTGTVTFDGKPLQEGDIIVSAAEGKVDSATGKISDGQYKVITTPGRKNVKISAQIVVNKIKDSPNDPNSTFQEIRKEILPDRYHNKSTLTIDLKAGPNTKDWTLESDKAS